MFQFGISRDLFSGLEEMVFFSRALVNLNIFSAKNPDQTDSTRKIAVEFWDMFS
jgi:hypothetical protein